MRSDKGRRQEREIARSLGVERLPNDGRRHNDAETVCFGIEAKARKRLPKLVTDGMAQCERACSPGKTPILVLAEVSQGRKAERYVVLRLKDFVDWFGALPAEIDKAQ